MLAVLRQQARSARRRVESNNLRGDPPSGEGVYGRGRGRPIVFAVLGDSSAVGLGVHRAAQTPGVLLAAALTELAERPVRLVRLAVSGAKSWQLDEQVDKALLEHPDVALIMIGANDVTSRTRPAISARHLRDAVGRLTEAGTQVVVGTCPDLGTVRPIAQPLRWLARRWSRQLAAAQTIAVVEAGGRTVSLGSVLGPSFAEDQDLFSVDEFHPARPATPRRPRSCCRRSPTRSASGRPRPTGGCATCAATPSVRSPGPPRRPPAAPAPR